MEKIEIGRALTMSVVRLQTQDSVGTGFFYRMIIEEFDDGRVLGIGTIVTNRHVLFGAINVQATFPVKQGEKIVKKTILLQDIASMVIYHDDPNVDLAVIPLSAFENEINEALGERFDIEFLSRDLIPDEQEIKTIEDVIVIGYPNGLWDDVNLRPLVRRGITASDYKLDFKGRPIFIIDCSIFPGSSGSPVFVLSEGVRRDALGKLEIGRPFLKFLGVNSAVYTHSVTGELIETKISSNTSIPNGLGVVVKAKKILDLENKVFRRNGIKI